jgi:tRNA threonylcarbamoyladenosine biosynthesis protein TsaB
MRILALDTSTAACSVALLCGDKMLSRFEVQPNQHARLLLPMIESVLAEVGLHQKQLDAIAFGRGPGSFTGLRIAASVTQGIAFAHDLPVIPVSSLQAMAQTAYQELGIKRILAAIDAHVQSFYYGAFILNEQTGCVEEVCSEKLISPADWKKPEGESWCYVGSGWHYFDFEATIDYYPKASALLLLARKSFESKAWVSAEETLPIYLHELDYLQRENKK